MAGGRRIDLLGIIRGDDKTTPGMRVIRVVTTEPAAYSFIFEGDKQAVDMALFEMPVSMYPLKIGDRMLVFPMVDTAASQRWAVVEKINGGVTLGTMTSGNSVQVAGIGRAYSGSELLVPPFIVRNNAQGTDPEEGHEYYRTGDLTPLQAGDLVSLMPTSVGGAIKYVVSYWLGG
ncbi:MULTISPECIES: hypothetical protein [Pelosinus]|uniref:Uncharacterized protein n=1 Tax=Pelosinus fermentans B4 TaxID=1149862 RepID=I9B461_9FIRM|nr:MULTISPECIES: hypothetical protein [Pelosinus]EIW19907.1 hypothetical protein FB4_0158 [Pelosinus fermentans B4]EIW21236.1 hypothetical protein FA11_0963 [Pelosinus fermentans A11]